MGYLGGIARGEAGYRNYVVDKIGYQSSSFKNKKINPRRLYQLVVGCNERDLSKFSNRPVNFTF